jgi:hypothetical protein
MNSSEPAQSDSLPADMNARNPTHAELKAEASLINLDQFFKRQPCARQSLIYGIGSGLAVGLLQYYRKRKILLQMDALLLRV